MRRSELRRIFDQDKLGAYSREHQELLSSVEPFNGGEYPVDNISFHFDSGTRSVAYLRCLFDAKGLFSPADGVLRFLDMGHKTALFPIYASRHGWLGYGIELCIDWYAVSKYNVTEAVNSGMVIDGSVRVANGSFFPSRFRVRRPRDTNIDVYRHSIEVHTGVNRNAYSELGITPKDIDLWYHFQVETFDNIIRFFAKYAKSGSFLLFNVTNLRERHKLPRKVHLEATLVDHINRGMTMNLYRKD